MQVPFDFIKQQVWDEIRKGMQLSNQTESFWDNVHAFAHAIHWKASTSSSLPHHAMRIVDVQMHADRTWCSLFVRL
jgi:hypothetical protein